MSNLQLRVSGHEFIGYGEARNKKTAQGLAAQMFVKHLVDEGIVSLSELPCSLDAVDTDDGSDVVGLACSI